jgi:hypothetical protein
MHDSNNALLLRIFLTESDRWGYQPLYEAIDDSVVGPIAK